ncbi:MAG: hypothetical protein KGJ43_08880 [Acidobacteriota bacterium]|nr:hypothetical protein [Acidobacteriota bacterium]
MRDVLITVVLVAVPIGAVVVVVGQTASSELYDRIGRGGLSMDGHEAGQSPPAGDSARRDAEVALEVRQMLAARHERIVRGGGEAPDLDAEVARLLAGPAPD